MNRNKALRRHQRWRKIKRATRTVVYRSHFEQPLLSLEYDDTDKCRLRNYLATTPVPCSCFMCGNPRKLYKNGELGKTMQERKAANDEKIGMAEWLGAA